MTEQNILDNLVLFQGNSQQQAEVPGNRAPNDLNSDFRDLTEERGASPHGGREGKHVEHNEPSNPPSEQIDSAQLKCDGKHTDSLGCEENLPIRWEGQPFGKTELSNPPRESKPVSSSLFSKQLFYPKSDKDKKKKVSNNNKKSFKEMRDHVNSTLLEEMLHDNAKIRDIVNLKKDIFQFLDTSMVDESITTWRDALYSLWTSKSQRSISDVSLLLPFVIEELGVPIRVHRDLQSIVYRFRDDQIGIYISEYLYSLIYNKTLKSFPLTFEEYVMLLCLFMYSNDQGATVVGEPKEDYIANLVAADHLEVLLTTLWYPNWWLVHSTTAKTTSIKFKVIDSYKLSVDYEYRYILLFSEMIADTKLNLDVAKFLRPQCKTKKESSVNIEKTTQQPQVIIEKPKQQPVGDNKEGTTSKAVVIEKPEKRTESFTAYQQLCGEYSFEDKTILISVLHVQEDDYRPLEMKPLHDCPWYYEIEETSCYFGNVVAINCVHLVSMLPLLNVRSRESIKNSLVAHNGYEYPLPYRYLKSVNSDDMLDYLEVLINSHFVSIQDEIRMPLDNMTSCYDDDSDVTIVWKKNAQPVNNRAYPLIPYDLGTDNKIMPINPEELKKACAKRMKCKLRKLDAYEYQELNRLVEKDVSSMPQLDHIYEEGVFINWVHNFCERKNLTLAQTASYYTQALVCEFYLQEGFEVLAALLLMMLGESTKSFIKDEHEKKESTLRYIISPHAYVKIILGPCFTAIEDALFYNENAPLKPYTISGKSPAEIKTMLEELQDQISDDTVICQVDGKAFEASQQGYLVQQEFRYYYHVAGKDPLAAQLLAVYETVCHHYIKLDNRLFSIIKPSGRLSGMNNTSKGNYIINRINALYIHAIFYYFEGDDGLLIILKDMVEAAMRRSMFPLTLITSRNVFELDFCGYHYNELGERTSGDFPTFWNKINTYFSPQPCSPQYACQLFKLRLISYMTMYPHDPNVKIAFDLFKQYFKDHEVPISSKVYNSFYRNNWWKINNLKIKLPYAPVEKLSDFTDIVPEECDNLSQEDMLAIIDNSSSLITRCSQMFEFLTRLPILHRIAVFIAYNVVTAVKRKWSDFKSYHKITHYLQTKKEMHDYAILRSRYGAGVYAADRVSNEYMHISNQLLTFQRRWYQGFKPVINNPVKLQMYKQINSSYISLYESGIHDIAHLPDLVKHEYRTKVLQDSIQKTLIDVSPDVIQHSIASMMPDTESLDQYKMPSHSLSSKIYNTLTMLDRINETESVIFLPGYGELGVRTIKDALIGINAKLDRGLYTVKTHLFAWACFVRFVGEACSDKIKFALSLFRPP